MRRLLSPRLTTSAAAAAALVLVSAAAAAAQVAEHQFSVTTRAGGARFDRASSLESTVLLGLDAEYGISKYFAIGTAVNVGRPNTRPEDFVSAITFGISTVGDTTLFLETAQSVSMIEGSLVAVGRVPLGRIAPFVMAGGGAYGLFMDPEINRGVRRMDGMSMTFGGGISFALSDRVGLQADARDVVFRNYKADRLDPSDRRAPNVTFLEDFPSPPTRKNTVHNIVFSLGFRYIPNGGGRRGGGGEGGN